MYLNHWTRRAQSVVTVFAILLMAFVGFLAVVPRASAITYVSGFITVDTTWGMTDTVYVIRGHVTVVPGVTLTITPGTAVRFEPGMALYIRGRLNANGMSNTPIQFVANQTSIPMPWYGVQFNASSGGSISWSTFDRGDRAVAAIDSSPSLTFNTVRSAGIAFLLVRSNAMVSDNVIQRASVYGIQMNQSNAQITRNTINGTFAGIEAEYQGSPIISNNVIMNSTGSLALGIWLRNGVAGSIFGNQINGVRGLIGANSAIPGGAGSPGGAAFGILVSDSPSATVIGNTVDTVLGGRGGNGAENPGGRGGNGAEGGFSAGIAIANTPSIDLEFNTVRSLTGGRGGNGGGNPTTTDGGAGGAGASAIGYYLVSASTTTYAFLNTADGVNGGGGGNGAIGSSTDGSGAVAGDATGFSLWNEASPDISGSTLQNIRGGAGGNSSAVGTGRGPGEGAGDASGIVAYGARGQDTIYHSNTISAVRGGVGGRGQASGGSGGNATGILVLGNDDGTFNWTSATSNQIQSITGGAGGSGFRRGGDGGDAGAITMVLSSWYTASNYLASIQAGAGGDATGGLGGGKGGDGAGLTAALVIQGSSQRDTVSSVKKGDAGAGPPVKVSYGTGVLMAGNQTTTTRLTVDNGTIQGVGDRDFWVSSYGEGTTINTPFNGAKIEIEAAGNLTVKNYLGVHVYWSDGFTFVSGATIVVDDEGTPIWNFVSASGDEQWLLATDRVYIQSNIATDNRTDVAVTYGSETFANNPRSVDMATTHTESFVMLDTTPPTSQANALPAYENTWNFMVSYTASDGSGSGLGNITLYYKWNGGGWIPLATQPAQPFGFFSFTASGDGVYEFATVADDIAANTEAGPSANDTWTIVDTVRPGSHVNPLPTYENTLSFLVTWAPDAGVTDIASYSIQYNRGSGWITWLTGTTLTSSTFTATTNAVYQFRSKATDNAGNVETVPATNDTWTIVDTFAPFTRTEPLPVWQTSSSFLVQWSSESTDTATFRIQVKDNSGAWTDWATVPVTTTSGTYTGAQDGHTYQFRSIGTDWAGNVQTPSSGNQSWTIVDLTSPDSAVAALPQYEIVLQFTVSWGPVSGTTDIVSYTLEVSENGGPWTQVSGAVSTTLTSTSYVGVDGHRYAFRTLSRDRAGNAEQAPAGNDTWTIVDVTRPVVVVGSPRGAGTNLTPTIVVTFSEPMNRASAEQAFTITPDMNGAFSWSADSRVMTFVPDRSLQGGTDYFVSIDSSARDVAGNSMPGPYPFQFATGSTSLGGGGGGGGAGDWIWLIGVLIAGALVGLFLFLFMRQRSAATSAAGAEKPKEDAVIDDVFLLYNDGLLIKHETRRLKPDVDSDILSGMLTAVQQFVKDSFRSEDAELNEMKFGQMHILLGRGKWLILAAIIGGDGSEAFTKQIQLAIEDMENHHWDQLESWNGDMTIARTFGPYVKKLIRGEYATATYAPKP